MKRIVDGRCSRRGVHAFWPANSDGDDIVLWTDDTRKHELARFNLLRQQETKARRPATSPLARRLRGADRDRLADYVGGLVTGPRRRQVVGAQAHTTTGAIMVKALADRLAEAFAESLHQTARREWGYGKDEQLTNEELISELPRHPSRVRLPGVPRALGRPSSSSCSMRQKLGISLTESFAMLPAASVSGIYLAHPEAKYFALRRINVDQVRRTRGQGRVCAPGGPGPRPGVTIRTDDRRGSISRFPVPRQGAGEAPEAGDAHDPARAVEW